MPPSATKVSAILKSSKRRVSRKDGVSTDPQAAPLQVRVYVQDEQAGDAVEQAGAAIDIDEARCQDLCQAALSQISAGELASDALASGAELEVNVCFVSEPKMAELNDAHMGADGPTDVLAFPLEVPTALSAAPLPTALPPTTLLGDIVVCPAVARTSVESREPAVPAALTTEIDTLIVHGLLHLLGMDHAKAREAKAMFGLQAELLEFFWRLHPPPEHSAPERPTKAKLNQ